MREKIPRNFKAIVLMRIAPGGGGGLVQWFLYWCLETFDTYYTSYFCLVDKGQGMLKDNGCGHSGSTWPYYILPHVCDHKEFLDVYGALFES